VLLQLGPSEHPDFRRHPHHQPQLDVDLSVLGPLHGAYESLGELVAHVARDGHDGRYAHVHHRRREHEGSPRTDETAYQPADEADDEQEQYVREMQIDEADFHRRAPVTSSRTSP
jgi:hypothetical protein